MIGEITNHLWQSTLFVLAAIVVAAALRRNGAHVRHAIWVAASVKFLIPFALLINLGSALPRFAPPTTAPVSLAEAASADLSDVVDWVAQPFTSDVFVSAALPVESGIDWITLGLAAAWVCGFLAIVLLRLRGWQRVRAAMRSSVPLPLAGPVPIRASAGLIEPGVVGIWRQVLLVPAGIEAQLTPAQLHAVLEHEYSHVRRRDNLTSAVHMVVEAAFWFHPVVWWVGARLIDERERACDEQVLRVCGEPQTYAESILNVCKLYVESPLHCVSGVTGSDLKKRIANIMINRVGRRLNFAGKAALAMAATLAFALPLAAGMVTAPADAAGAAMARQAPAAASSVKFEVASIKPCDPNSPPPQPPAIAGGRSGGGPWYAMTSPGYVYWHCATLAQLIPQAYASLEQPLMNVMAQPKVEDNFQPTYVKGGPSWVTTDKFTIEVKAVLDMTAPALDGRASRSLTVLPAAMSQALRSLLEDRFQLKVRRGTEPRDVYALTLGKGGLNKARVTTPVPGDCMTVEEYFASPAASAPLEERMKNAGKYKICGRTTTDMFASFTFNQLAVYFQNGGLLGDVVVNRTGVEAPFNFAMVLAPRTEGTAEERIARALEPLGLKLERIKAPADSLVIESVQKLRSDTSASAPAFAPAESLAEAQSAKADAPARQAKFDVASIKPCDPSVPAPNAGVSAGGRRGGAPWFAMVSPGYVYWHCATLAQLIPQAYTTVDQPLQNTVMEVRFDEGNQPSYVKGGPSWVTADTFTIEAKAPLDLTSPALEGRANRTLAALPPAMSQALRSLLEDRFQLKVRRVTEERDVYAMTLAKGGLDPKRVTAPTPGDCQTTAEYFASPFGKSPLLEQAKALDQGLPRICGGILSMRNGRLQYTSVTLDKLAKDMSRQTNFVVVDQTGVSTIVNFTLEIEPYTAGTVDERFTRAAEQLGLKISRVKLPTEHLMIESVQKLRPNTPADR